MIFRRILIDFPVLFFVDFLTSAGIAKRDKLSGLYNCCHSNSDEYYRTMRWVAAGSSWHAAMCVFVRSNMRWVAAGSSWHAAMRVSVRSNMRWVAAGGTNDDDDDDDDDENEKHGIPDNPPQQRTQGTNTPFEQTPHSDNSN